MVAADSSSITIAHNYKNLQPRLCYLGTGSKSQRTAVCGMYGIKIHITGHTRRAADAGDHQHVILWVAELIQCSGQCRHHDTVAAARAPDMGQIAAEILFIYSFHYSSTPNSAALASTAF